MKLQPFNPRKARIEIVPMIDTIFFLLVYFMMATLTMTKLNAQHVGLPSSQTATLHPTEEVVVTVDKQGRYFIDRTEVALAGLAPSLTARLTSSPNSTVVINCDKDQTVSRFGAVYDLVKQANARSVMVATTPKDDWGTK